MAVAIAATTTNGVYILVIFPFTFTKTGTDVDDGSYTVTVIKGNNALSSNVTKTDTDYNFKVIFNKKKIESFESAILIAAIYDEYVKVQ